MFLHHRTRLQNSVLLFFPLLAMVFSFSSSVLSPIIPLYLREIVHQETTIGFTFALLALLSLFFEMLVGPLLFSYDVRRLLQVSFFFLACSFFLFPFVYSLPFFFFLELFRLFFFICALLCLGLCIHASAPGHHLGNQEGASFSLINFAWLLGPLMGGFVADTFSVRSVFYVAGVLALLPLLLLFFYRRPLRLIHPPHFDLRKTCVSFFADTSLRSSYLMTASLTGYMVLVAIFLPLHFQKLGAGPALIGFIFFLTMLPLFLFEFFAGHLGERYSPTLLIAIGFFIVGFFTLLLSFTDSFWLFVFLLVFAYLGISLIQPNLETRFFSLVSSAQEIRYYAIYKTSIQIGALVGLALASLILLVAPLFVLLFFVGLYAILFALWSFSKKSLNS